MKKLRKIPLSKLNVSEHLAHHLMGTNCTNAHRKTIGIIIILLGTFIAEIHIVDMTAIRVLQGAFGFSLHGIGLLPFLIGIEEKQKSLN